MSDDIVNRIEFNFYPDDRSNMRAVNLGVDVEDDMHIATIHRLCRYFAMCLGYTPETVNKYFGEEHDDDW